MSEPLVPYPDQLTVCGVCRESWDEHVRMAQWWDDEDEPGAPAHAGEITLEQCVRLLRRRGQGPPGPVGPMGATGLAGTVVVKTATGAEEIARIVREHLR